jgi:hypothetical protein
MALDTLEVLGGGLYECRILTAALKGVEEQADHCLRLDVGALSGLAKVGDAAEGTQLDACELEGARARRVRGGADGAYMPSRVEGLAARVPDCGYVFAVYFNRDLAFSSFKKVQLWCDSSPQDCSRLEYVHGTSVVRGWTHWDWGYLATF